MPHGGEGLLPSLPVLKMNAAGLVSPQLRRRCVEIMLCAPSDAACGEELSLLEVGRSRFLLFFPRAVSPASDIIMGGDYVSASLCRRCHLKPLHSQNQFGPAIGTAGMSLPR
jgi:hypothetical protein